VNDAELADAHDANFVAAIGLMAESIDGGFTRSFGDVRLAVTRVPFAFFNAIFVTSAVTDGAADLSAALDCIRAEQLPFVVHVRADRPADVAAARALGLTGDERLPCFALEPGTAPSAPEGLEIVRVDGESFDGFLDAMVAGFDMPRALGMQLFPPNVLDAPGVRGYLGRVSGQPVATAVGVRTDDVMGIYSVATVPEARGRGYGTALTWATMADADPPLRACVLQASAMGRPVYERMGFRLVCEFIEMGDA
jgi:GNAT superfamily N-acetyltransferase